MVLLTEKYNFLAASCCNVEVVKGAAGDFFAGFFSKLDTEKEAELFCSKNAFASASLLNTFGSFALNTCPLDVVNSASTLKVASELKSLISRSRSTISRTETDCTRPAESPPLTLRHTTGDNSYPTILSKTRRACCASTKL